MIKAMKKKTSLTYLVRGRVECGFVGLVFTAGCVVVIAAVTAVILVVCVSHEAVERFVRAASYRTTQAGERCRSGTR